VGSPFTSFGLEAARVYATAAREQPLRLATIGLVPSAMTAVNLADAGMTVDDWTEMKKRMPSYMQGKVLIPFASNKGGVDIADWSNFVPLGGVISPGKSPADMGPNRDFLFGGPLWNMVKLLFNYQGPGQKAVDPAKGETWPTTGVWKGAKGVAPVPSAVTTGAERIPAAVNEVPPRRGAEPESIPQAAWFSLFGGLDAKHEDEVERAGKGERRGAISEAKRGKRSNQKNPTLSGEEKSQRKQNILDYIRERKGR
jgi:hypothetical protein